MLRIGCWICVITAIYAKGVTVETQGASYTGFTRDITIQGNTTRINVFLGVKYAQQPVGQLRFHYSRKLAKTKKKRIVDAVKHGDACPQQLHLISEHFAPLRLPPEVHISEDCLHVDIYTPFIPEQRTKKKELLPVFIWYHGGNFQSGSSSLYDGSALAAFTNSVVVVVNWRVGIFGFFSGYHFKHTLGNYGLTDVTLSAKWIVENAASFGGSSMAVTIGGHGSGGAAVTSLVTSGMSGSLFQRVLSLGGSISSHGWFSKTPQQRVKLLASKLGCPEDLLEFRNCSLNHSIQAILEADSDLDTGPVPWGLVLDKRAIRANIETLIKEHFDKPMGKLLHLWLGISTYGTLKTGERFHPGLGERKFSMSQFKLATRDVLRNFFPKADIGDLFQKTLQFYTTAEHNEFISLKQAYSNIVYDLATVIPVLEFARQLHSLDIPPNIYLSDFTYQSPLTSRFSVNDAEILYLFGEPFMRHRQYDQDVVFTDVERAFSLDYMTYLKSFMKSGKPNRDHNLPEWKKFDHGHENYLNIKLKPELKSFPRPEVHSFWKQVALDAEHEHAQKDEL